MAARRTLGPPRGGTYAVDNNLLAAGVLIVGAPTLIVYFLLQRQIIAGLTLGSTKE